jgi:Domain of unknown function (DUF4352)
MGQGPTPSSGWWQDAKGKWHEGPRPDQPPQAPAEPQAQGDGPPPAPQGPPAQTVQTKVCPNCGVQSQTTSDRCPSCGKKYKQKKGGGCLKIIGIGTLLFIALIIAIVAASGGGGDGDSGGSDGGSDDGGEETTEQVASVGDVVELKGTSYQVTNVRTAQAVGGEFNRTQADGIFVILDLTLTNLEDEPATIVEDAVRIVGGNGNEYTTDSDAFAAFENQLVILQEIQPDLAKKVVAVYDIPPGATSGAKLEVRDLFSDERAQIDLGL